MATVTTGLRQDSTFLNLKEIGKNAIRSEVFELLVSGEEVCAAFQTVRDQVIFTNKRVFVVNVQGITGKKISYLSYPYSKVQYYGVETAGVLDIDAELLLAFNDGTSLTFDFKTNVDIRGLCAMISGYVL